MVKSSSIMLVLAIAGSSNSYGEDLQLNDFSYTKLYGVDLKSLEASSLTEPKKIEFKFSSDRPPSIKETLKDLRPRWRWVSEGKYNVLYHYTLTLSDDDEEYVTLDIRF